MKFWFYAKYWGMSLEGFSCKSSLRLLYGEWNIFNMNGPRETSQVAVAALTLNAPSQPLGGSEAR